MSGIIAQNSGRHAGLIKAASAGGVWNLILTQTASSSATISFTSGIDSTYDEYVFKFHAIHPATNLTNFLFQVDKYVSQLMKMIMALMECCIYSIHLQQLS